MSTEITHIHHCSVLISDTEQALAFYQGVLGLTVNPDRPDLGYPGAWLDVGDQQIHLLELPNPDAGLERPQHGGRDRHVALVVNDLEWLIDRLQQSEILYSLSRSGRRALFCHDPDGNALEFIQTDG
ncbi:MAG TPA: glyoxalase [Gammaproteobacteria bacterium]|nr:glyoxalase [Gammaproteobacteria bacterium]